MTVPVPIVPDKPVAGGRKDVPAGEVARLYRAGWTVTQVAAKYHIAPSTVLRRLDAAGVARRPTSVPVAFPVEEAARRVRQEGASFAQLARDYRVGVGSVRGQLRARGIQAPPRTGPRVLRDIPAAQIARRYTSGLTIAAIAASYGVSPDTIGARLRAAGVAARPATIPIPVPEAAALYQHGATLTELADKYGVTMSAIYRKLTAAGLRMRPRGSRRIPIPVAEAARLYAAGQTLRQLARRYGVCETVIYHRLTEAGTPLRRRTDPKGVDPGLLARLARQAGLDAGP